MRSDLLQWSQLYHREARMVLLFQHLSDPLRWTATIAGQLLQRGWQRQWGMKTRGRQRRTCEKPHNIWKILWGCVSETFLETNNQMESYTTRSARGVLNSRTKKQTPGNKGQGEDQTHTVLKITGEISNKEISNSFPFWKTASNIEEITGFPPPWVQLYDYTVIPLHPSPRMNELQQQAAQVTLPKSNACNLYRRPIHY